MSELDQVMAVMEAAFDPHWREAWTRQQVANSLAMPHTYAILVDENGHRISGENTAAGFVLARRAPAKKNYFSSACDPKRVEGASVAR